MFALARVSGGVEPLSVNSGDAIVSAWLSGRSPRTLRAYQGDLADFAAWAGCDAGTAISDLMEAGNGGANRIALEYRASLMERGLSPATVNRRLAALRSILGLARMLGVITWKLDAPSLKAKSYRDTRGPGVDAVRAMLKAAEGQAPAKAARDVLIIRMLFGLGLRRSELAGANLEDVDARKGVIWIRGKGRNQEAEALTLPGKVSKALNSWIRHRGDGPGPLITTLDRSCPKGARISGEGVRKIVKRLGEAVGVTARPHGLRHAGITCFLDMSGGDIRSAQRLARHASPQTTIHYDDNRRDLAGEAADLISGAV